MNEPERQYRFVEVIGRRTNIDFLGKRNIAFAFSGIFLIMGIVAFVQLFTGTANLGLEFTGGTSIELKPVGVTVVEVRPDQPVRDLTAAQEAVTRAGFAGHVEPKADDLLVVRLKDIGQPMADAGERIVAALNEAFPLNKLTLLNSQTQPPVEVRIDRARQLLDQAGITGAIIQDVRGERKLLIRIKTPRAVEEEAASKILSAFQQAHPEAEFDVSAAEIGATIGTELRARAGWAIMIAALGIILYIAVRFDFKFGVAALIATLHDVFFVLGLVWLKNFIVPTEITLLIMTAILTLAGYSLTDTVVVFDRIRENLKKHQRESLVKVINASINQVLSRTIITALTTFLVLMMLFSFGGEVLKDFSFTLGVGVIVGTYSSIFVASPFLLIWGQRSRLMGATPRGEASRPAARTHVR